MKAETNTVWRWLLGAFFLILALIGFIVWKSYQPRELPNPLADNPAQEIQHLSTNKASDKTKASVVNPSNAALPAPAKKLQTLIDDPQNLTGSIDDKALAERMEKLNKQLAEINQQLEKQGLKPPTNASQPNNTSPNERQQDIEDQLSAIKTFMEDKEQTKTAQ